MLSLWEPRVDVAKIFTVLGVVAERRVVDIDVHAIVGWRADPVAIATIALPVAGDRGVGVGDGVFLVAAVPFDGGVGHAQHRVDAGRSVAIVEVPTGQAVVSDIDAVGCDLAADRPDDAAIGMPVHPEILQQHVMGVNVRVNAAGVVVVERVVLAATLGKWRVAMQHASGVAP